MRIIILCLLLYTTAIADDWPMGGRTNDRNPVSLEKNLNWDWKISEKDKPTKSVLWTAEVGSRGIGGPEVADGLVWIGTNNEKKLDPMIEEDCGVYACFRASDGKFLYQYATPRLDAKQNATDWPVNGTGGSPITEKNRIWFVTNRREVVCLDTEPLIKGKGLPKELWKYDLIKELDVAPNSPMINGHNMHGSPAIHNDLIYIPTGNGVDVDHPGAFRVRNPKAPSLVCLNKKTGKLVWKDSSTGAEGIGGSYAAPLIVTKDKKTQVIHPQADGWVRSYEAETGKLIWKFNVNPRNAEWGWKLNDDVVEKTVAIATPVYHDGKVYFGLGREYEFAGSNGKLFCIDPFRAGDISPEIELGKVGVKPNPSSGLIWQFHKFKYTDKKGKTNDCRIAQTESSVAIHNGFLVACDYRGFVHCLDAKTGKHYWSYDSKERIAADPVIVDGKIIIGTLGKFAVLELSEKLKVINTLETETIYATSIVSNEILYLLSEQSLYAINLKKVGK